MVVFSGLGSGLLFLMRSVLLRRVLRMALMMMMLRIREEVGDGGVGVGFD